MKASEPTSQLRWGSRKHVDPCWREEEKAPGSVSLPAEKDALLFLSFRWKDQILPDM